MCGRRLALFFTLLLLVACRTPSPAITPALPTLPTATLPLTPSPLHPLTPASLQPLTVPHWLSFDYPADWFRIAGRAPGFAGVASRDIGILPENRLSGDSALFYVFRGEYMADEPLVAMQEERVPRLNADIEVLSPPTAATIGDLPAATFRYRFSLEDGAPGVVRLTLVRAADGRYAENWAVSRESEAARYDALFEDMAQSLTLHEQLPAPALDVPPQIPTGYVPVPGGDFSLSLPPDWRATATDFGLLARPSAVPDAAQIVAGPIPGGAVKGATGTELLNTIAGQLLPELIFDAVRVSPVAGVERTLYDVLPAAPTPGATAPVTANDALDIARAYYSGSDQGQPRFIVVSTLVQGDTQLYALALLDIPTASPPALLGTAETILDTLTPTTSR